jgi:hypothetical protein
MSNAFKLTIIKEKQVGHIKNMCYKSSLANPLDEEASYILKSLDYEKIHNRIPVHIENKHEVNHLWIEQAETPLQFSSPPV